MLRCTLLLLGLILAAPSSALAKPSCGKGGPTGEGQANAGAGSYLYNVPSGYDPTQAIPILFALHGDEGKPDYIYSSFKSLQKSQGGPFILVAPRAPFGGGSWYKATSQHTTFIDAVIAEAKTQWNIDEDRIWITGWSGGATFLGNYVTSRQDILSAVVFYLGAGGAWLPYSPPAGSCKIPARFVIGTADFLYSNAADLKQLLEQKGHQVSWVELPGVGHDFQKSTLPDTWTWLKGKTLCNTTIPGSCPGDPPPTPDQGVPPAPDQGAPNPKADLGSGPSPPQDAGGPRRDTIIQLPPGADGGPASPSNPGSGGELVGSCAVAASDQPSWLPLLLLLLLGLRPLRRRDGER
jgi:MYXO-CTERM domain-containing protein